LSSKIFFEIKHQDLTLKVRLEEIDKLKLHEEIIPEALEKLMKAIEKDGIVYHPVIVDEKSLVVLDGMHRVEALRRIGCIRMPVCLVDYFSPLIRVDRWYRTVKGGDVEGALAKAGIKYTTVKRQEAEDVVNNKSYPCSVLVRDFGFIIEEKFKDIYDAYQIVSMIERVLTDRGLKIGYETEDDAVRMLDNGNVDAVVVTPPINKKDVIDVALSGRVFIPKTTRHIVPARPLFVNVPLDLLRKTEISLEDANKEFIEMLKKRKIKHLPPGTRLDRRYDEDLYVFE